MISGWAIFKLPIPGPGMASPSLLNSFGNHRLSDHFAIADRYASVLPASVNSSAGQDNLINSASTHRDQKGATSFAPSTSLSLPDVMSTLVASL